MCLGNESSHESRDARHTSQNLTFMSKRRHEVGRRVVFMGAHGLCALGRQHVLNRSYVGARHASPLARIFAQSMIVQAIIPGGAHKPCAPIEKRHRGYCMPASSRPIIRTIPHSPC